MQAGLIYRNGVFMAKLGNIFDFDNDDSQHSQNNRGSNQGGNGFNQLSSLLPEVQTKELDSGETTTYRCHQRARRIDAEPMNL